MKVVKVVIDAGSGMLSLRPAVPESNVWTDDVLEPSHQGVVHMSLAPSCLLSVYSGGDEVVFSLGNCVFQQYGYCRLWQKE